VAFDRAGGRIVSGLLDETVRVWDAATGAELACLHGHEKGVNSVAFDRAGGRIVSGSDDGTVRVWDAATVAEGQ
jgi:WD40 repeat protein